MLAVAASLPLGALRDDYDAMKRVATLPGLIDAGVLAATLSSALASFLGAPRILQALANDRLFGWLTPLGVGYGPAGNPRRAVTLTAVIALVTLALGNLNTIAAVVSMFFLVSYALLNYATYVEAVGASPSFRPRFRFFNARASLAGTGLCGFVMLMIDPMASAVALGILGALYHYLRWSAVPVAGATAAAPIDFIWSKTGCANWLTIQRDPPTGNRTSWRSPRHRPDARGYYGSLSGLPATPA